MEDYKVPTDEQETVIRFDRNGTVCHIYTTDSTMMTKLDKKYKRVKQDCANRTPIAAYYEFDKGLLSFRSIVPKRTLTAEQKKAAAERLEKGRKMR